MRISRVATHRCAAGESPLWDPAGQALFFVDNSFSAEDQRLCRFDPAAETTELWELPAPISALALREGGGAVVALVKEVHALDLATGALTLLSPREAVPRRRMIADGKVDGRGRFVVGMSSTNLADPAPDGGVYSLDADHRLTACADGVHIANGPCFSPDGRTFYIADSHESALYAFDYDVETGALADRRLFARTHELGGLPDGATVDRDGLVWSSIYQGAKLAAFRPDGRLERTVELPTRLPSSVGFGGPDLDRLYVTSIARESFLGEADEAGGYVFAIDGLGTRGLAEPKYVG
jgi:sugar lactone lactonase YvrE